VEMELRLPQSLVLEAQARIVDLSRGRSQAKRLD
jgi:hypothetical protein